MVAMLVVGCGLRPKLEAINLDRFDLKGVDIVYDLDFIRPPEDRGSPPLPGLLAFPEPVPHLWKRSWLPFADGTFWRVEADDVLEHVNDLVTVVNELHRVLRQGGALKIRGPHWNYPEQVWSDPTHRRAFADRSFDGWDKSTFDGREYGHYFHQGRYFFKVVERKEVNKGMEYLLIKE